MLFLQKKGLKKSQGGQKVRFGGTIDLLEGAKAERKRIR